MRCPMIIPNPPIRTKGEFTARNDSKTTPTITVIIEQLSNIFASSGLELKMIFRTTQNEIKAKKRSR